MEIFRYILSIMILMAIALLIAIVMYWLYRLAFKKIKSYIEPSKLLKYHIKRKMPLIKKYNYKIIYNGTKYVFYDYERIIKDLKLVNEALSAYKFNYEKDKDIKPDLDINNYKFIDISILNYELLLKRLNILKDFNKTHKNPYKYYVDHFLNDILSDNDASYFCPLLHTSTLYWSDPSTFDSKLYSREYILDENKNIVKNNSDEDKQTVNFLVDMINNKNRILNNYGLIEKIVLPNI